MGAGGWGGWPPRAHANHVDSRPHSSSSGGPGSPPSPIWLLDPPSPGVQDPKLPTCSAASAVHAELVRPPGVLADTAHRTQGPQARVTRHGHGKKLRKKLRGCGLPRTGTPTTWGTNCDTELLFLTGQHRAERNFQFQPTHGKTSHKGLSRALSAHMKVNETRPLLEASVKLLKL